MFNTGNTIFCERVEEGLGSLEFDMTLPFVAERRIPEIALVTPMKAPELLALFNEAYLCVGRYYAELELELDRAYTRAEKRKAIIILDEVPAYVQQKGLASARSPMGSEDIRSACVARDDKYFNIQDKISNIKATRELMAIKMKGIEMAYNSVKKILGERQFGITNPLNGTIPEHADVGDQVEESTGKIKGWGKPRY
jgi:hypothetical protein